jgi:hypothetical protein
MNKPYIVKHLSKDNIYYIFRDNGDEVMVELTGTFNGKHVSSSKPLTELENAYITRLFKPKKIPSIIDKIKTLSLFDLELIFDYMVEAEMVKKKNYKRSSILMYHPQKGCIEEYASLLEASKATGLTKKQVHKHLVDFRKL